MLLQEGLDLVERMHQVFSKPSMCFALVYHQLRRNARRV